MENKQDERKLPHHWMERCAIVYAEEPLGYESSARTLQTAIERITGIRPPVRAEGEPLSAAFEILIGCTNRPLSHVCYSQEDDKRLMTFALYSDSKSLQLACGGPHSARLGVEAFVRVLANGSLSEALGVKHDLAPERLPLTQGADIRIMSANVLGECYRLKRDLDRYPLSVERAEILAKLLADYTPDLVGVQEMDVNFHKPLLCYFKILKQYYGVSYSMILTDHLDRTNDCPIIYRSDKYRVIHQCFVPARYALADHAEKFPTQYPCGVSSAVFASLSDPTSQTALLSNHWHWEKEEKASVPPKQQIDAEDLAATVLELEASYPNARVFSTGDFNSHRFDGKYFEQFLSATNGVTAEQIAEANGSHSPGLVHRGCLIDHIVGRKGSFDVLLHRPTHNRSNVLTDHLPIFADIKFLSTEER
ncbi:MAG: hypothetical protein E7620_08185 [Ruminococcaceae bacterium]|nr:hypothetical protein [Oscillospiraceae bacterium]